MSPVFEFCRVGNTNVGLAKPWRGILMRGNEKVMQNPMGAHHIQEPSLQCLLHQQHPPPPPRLYYTSRHAHSHGHRDIKKKVCGIPLWPGRIGAGMAWCRSACWGRHFAWDPGVRHVDFILDLQALIEPSAGRWREGSAAQIAVSNQDHHSPILQSGGSSTDGETMHTPKTQAVQP
jgi:hypothetical protein